ncbi:HMA2 domain-containing protein [Peterkaempfera bronchialis]|uniref:HMA2 domain-containing protein n=1 Tax=Peterkaempfera bronchialis TaxID=2126346 RepID=UPI003C2D2C77
MESELRPRSVIPGRQRWDVGILLGSPRIAELLAAVLRRTPGITTVRANPVTGRVLILYDTALSPPCSGAAGCCGAPG